MAFLRLERGIERRHRRIGGEVVGVAIDLLAFLRDDEIDQQLGGVGMRRVLVDADAPTSVPVAGSILIQSTGAPFLALITA